MTEPGGMTTERTEATDLPDAAGDGQTPGFARPLRRIGDAAGSAPAAPRRSIEERTPPPAAVSADPTVAVDPTVAADPGGSKALLPEVDDVPPGGGAHQEARRWRRRLTAAIGLVVVLLAAVIFLGLKVRNQDNVNSLRASALSNAAADGALLSSYDYRNLTGPGSAWSKVEKAATPSFRKSFLSTSGSLGKLLTQYNATATGKVISVGLASFSPSRAVVLLFIDQTVNNTVQKSAASTQPLRTELTLLRHGGRWLINDLQVPQ